MSNELLDFTKQDNFEFFEFSEKKNLHPDVQAILKQECEHVLDIAYTTVQDMCLLGFNLKELKNSRNWEFVKNPRTGELFFNHSFQEFCEYAFGFSKTKTSDLLRIAEFVKVSGTKNNGFIDERYSGYNTSQLVELAPVREEDRKYFNPEMPVAEMRKIKDYMKNGLFCMEKHEPDFDLKKKAEEYHERKNKKDEDEERPNVIPGQIELGEEVFEPEQPEQEEANPTSDLEPKSEYLETVRENGYPDYVKNEEEAALICEAVVEHNYSPEEEEAESFPQSEDLQEDEEDPYDMPMQTHSYDSDYSPEAESEEEDQEESKYDFSIREGVRAFLNDYKNWQRNYGYIGCFFKGLYEYRLKNGVTIIAAEGSIMTGDGGVLISEDIVSYYLNVKSYERAFEISKRQFEVYCKMHKDEL